MTTPLSEFSYQGSNGNHQYYGALLDDASLREYLVARVRGRFQDTVGQRILENDFSDIATTEFEQARLSEIFRTTPAVDDWRVGECLAECFLEDNHSAIFPYPTSRDSRNPNSSPAGADLVGISMLDDNPVFIFGEVKCSTDTNTPPNVMYGKSGMVKQLEGIRDDKSISDALARWLLHKVVSLPDDQADLKDKVRGALQKYLRGEKRMIGVLIRDISPNEADLRARFEFLVNGIDGGDTILLTALYLPFEIKDLANLE